MFIRVNIWRLRRIKSQSSTESSNSIFKTPESIGNDQVHSTPNSEISSTKSTNIRNIVPPSEPKAPVSNLSKIIAAKRAERAAQSSSSNSTVLTTAQKPVQTTVSVQVQQPSPQVANTVSQYGRVRKQTQHFQSS